ncbi:MAG: MgtC/SapB family protein [Clostridia bacterium]|nr:MgtC/SapB family protein [Clostridia bacterium]
MLPFAAPLRELSFLSVLLRLFLACACGAVVGLERSAKNRPAGFRTHILVCMAAALAALSGLYLYLVMGLPTDISRIGAQVISGLGFIGAGAIIVTPNMDIKGLTTAAGLWVTGIIGLAIGSGYYEGGIVGTVLVLLTETLLTSLSSRIQKRPLAIFRVYYREKTSLDQVLRTCKDEKMTIVNLRIRLVSGEEEQKKYRADVTLCGTAKTDVLLSKIEHMPGIEGASEA